MLSTAVNNKNRIAGASYDAAGNILNGSAVYDAESRMTSVIGLTHTYDSLGRRSMKSDGPLYWYGLERAGTEVFLETDTTGDIDWIKALLEGLDPLTKYDDAIKALRDLCKK